MFFKIFTVVAALASLATGSAAAVIEARQVGALATCNIVTTPSNGFTGGSLSEEFIILFNREFANDLPPENAIVTGSTSFTANGPNFTIRKTTGATGLTADQTRGIMRGWAGQTFAGAGQVGVSSWNINSVTC